MPQEAEIEQVLAHLARHRPAERTLPNVRRYLDAMLAMEPPLSDVTVRRETIGGVPADVLAPPGGDASRLLLYLHGGGYALGSAEGYRPLTTRVAKAFGGTVWVPDYRLAPEHPFPHGIEDAVAATRAAIAARGAKRVVLVGDSAGGGLVLAVLFTLRGAGEEMPAAAALLSPWVDLEGGQVSAEEALADPIITKEGMGVLAGLYLGERDRKHPLAAARYAELAGLPPLLIHTGTREIQRPDVRAFAERLKAAKVDVILKEWDGMLHVFHMFPVLTESGRAIAHLGAWLTDCLRA